MKIKLLILTLLVCGFSWGQLTESFESGLPGAYNATLSNATLGSGTWQIANVIAGTTGVNTGSKSAQVRNATAAQIITPTISGGVGIISFYVTGSTSSGAYQVNVSTDDGASWSPATGSPFTIGATKTLKSITVNNSSVNKVQIVRTGATIYIDDFNTTSYSSGITTAQNGNWNVGSTWTGGVVPLASEDAIINHNVTLNGNITRNAGTTTTVNTGKDLETGAFTYTNNGTTTINGTLIIKAGGYVNGTTNLVYGIASELIMAHANSTPYAINAGQRFWPIANPPYKVTLNSNSPTQLNMKVGTVAGKLTLNAGIDVATANALTINGMLDIRANGFVNTNSPIYGPASTLAYSTGGVFGRGFEWRALGIGTIGTTPGYPNNVAIQLNTVLNYINTAVPNAVGIKAIAGNLTIASAGSALYMDTGAVAAGGALIVGGSVNVTGTLRLGVGVNDDLKIGGNFNLLATGTFDGKQRKVFFTNNILQDILGTVTIPYLICAPVSGSSMLRLNGVGANLTISAPAGGNAITFNSAGDTFNISTGTTLTIGTTGVSNVISGAGTFRGTTTSVLNLLGTGSIGTLSFGGIPSEKVLGTFTVNRTSGAIACVLGSDLNVSSTMNLTAGIVDINASALTLTSSSVLNGASASNYFIADNAFGGILRKGYSTTGSFTFPIGDKTGTMEYSPATFNLSTGTGMSTATIIGMSVNDSKHPNMTAPTNFISRYWSVKLDGSIGTPTYTLTGTYLNADINGTEANSLSQFWNGSAWSTAGASLVANTLQYAGATTLPTSGSYDFTAGRREQEINIKQSATSIATGATYNFGTVLAGSSSSATFTIENLGNANLTINANPTMAGSAYSLTTPIVSNVTISSMGTTTFTIQFAPVTGGPFTGSISIVNNDSDENPYVINFTGNGTGSFASDISKITASELPTLPSFINGNISTITDGMQVWRFNLRDGGATLNDSDALPTTLTDLVISQATGDQIGNWDESIQDIVLVNLTTNTIVAHGVVIANQIQFNGINVVAADNTQVALALRLTLKCPLGVGALDGDDFGFSITNANTTFAPSGSGKTTFSVQTSANSRNVLAVVAKKLTFITQPITTGVSTAMGSVVIIATDACGNHDKDYTGAVSITSTGTMNPIGPINAIGGIATFTGILHSVVGTDFNLTASATGLIPAVSTLFDISNITVLNPGDLAVLAVNTLNSSGYDEISFVCFRDLLPGTELFITDNGYERKTAGLWGGTEGVISIIRTGSILPKGTIISIITNSIGVKNGSQYDVYVCGAVDSNWTKNAVTGTGVGGFDLNNSDDIYFMQGGAWTNNVLHASTYSGNVLYGWTESGWDSAPGGTGGDSKFSTLYPGMECFNTVAPPGPGKVKFNDPVNPDFSTTTNSKFDWIALINNQSNWSTHADNADYVANGYDYIASCTIVNLATSPYVNGKWSGRKDSNWFNCLNWETLIVPKETTDVLIPDTTYDRPAEIDAADPLAIYSNYIAKVKNLTITGEKVVIKDNIANKLEVHGDLTIANTVADRALNMNGGTATDGQLYLYGNWTNNKNNAAFDEGNGTVHFMGTTAQIINAVTPLGTESFKNVVLNNNFDTAVSNDLIAKGNVTLNSGKTLSIDANGYALVYDKLTSNGNVIIASNGQLIQVDDTDANDGDYSGTKFTASRNYTATHTDYVYWSAPTKLFPSALLPTGYRYEWNPIEPNGNGTFGNWISPTPLMVEGKGYIARTFNGFSTPTTLPFTFKGQPNNGLINVEIKRGNIQGGAPAQWDDNWNLVGNPYPSAINSLTFLANSNNPEIEGFVHVWTHATPLSVANPNPFYDNFLLNYTSDDYVVYNGTGPDTGPFGFNGYIASGQGFFVMMKDGPAATRNLIFNNSMRRDVDLNIVYDNSQFFRNTAESLSVGEEKHRIWLDIVSPQNKMKRTLVGYVATATNENDRLFDALTTPISLDVYSFLDPTDPQEYCIQGRSLPFVDSDTVKLGIKVPAVGQYKIAIGAVDGLFTTSQPIYLEDKLLDVIHDLRATPYDFSSTAGQFDDRFVLRYTSSTLGSSVFDAANTVIVSSNNSQIDIISHTENISQVQVFDMLGRQLYSNANLDSLSHSITNIAKNQALIIKIKLNNGSLISKKIIVK